MKKSPSINLKELSVDEMWELHEEISRLLSIRLTSEKLELEKRLAQLRRDSPGRREHSAEPASLNGQPKERRKYPRVFPKYRNPNEPSETWSGRGKQPRWLTAALKSGHRIEDFAISETEKTKSGTRRR